MTSWQHCATCLAEQSAQGDERQALQSGGVCALQAFEEGDAEPLALEAASAVVGFFLAQVGLHLCHAELPEVHREGFQVLKPYAVGLAQ